MYLQGRLHLSALHAGLDFLPMGVAAILTAIFVARLVTRVGTRPASVVVPRCRFGLILLARSRPEGAYDVELLPGLLLFGAGVMSSVGIPTQVAGGQ